ncbi:hypothetical protein BaRGS_00035705 [Batillaria attramentaria]|uniref:Uncharacterized protein n=1 Tax=Batillaria attramentaria TaxID=370345 RepID=A0ABD0JF99_9CAEN
MKTRNSKIPRNYPTAFRLPVHCYAEEADWRWQSVRIQHEYSLHGKVTTAGLLARTAVLVSRSATWGSHSVLSRHGGECFQCHSRLDNATEKLPARTAFSLLFICVKKIIIDCGD